MTLCKHRLIPATKVSHIKGKGWFIADGSRVPQLIKSGPSSPKSPTFITSQSHFMAWSEATSEAWDVEWNWLDSVPSARQQLSMRGADHKQLSRGADQNLDQCRLSPGMPPPYIQLQSCTIGLLNLYIWVFNADKWTSNICGMQFISSVKEVSYHYRRLSFPEIHKCICYTITCQYGNLRGTLRRWWVWCRCIDKVRAHLLGLPSACCNPFQWK